ncbi:MAG: hypothetical protein SGI77_03340 [Pirellulaceae bacterium]|nr:hypothetical protein [Pirellulaceae bacterium]
MNTNNSHFIRVCSIGFGFFCLFGIARSQEKNEKPAAASVELHVLDVDKHAIENAKVTYHEWTGRKWTDALATGFTNTDGNVELTINECQGFATLRVEAKDFGLFRRNCGWFS